MPPRYIISSCTPLSFDPEKFPLLSGFDREICPDEHGILWLGTVAFSDGTREPLFTGGVLTSAEISKITLEIAQELVERYCGKTILLLQLLEGAIPFCERISENLRHINRENLQYDIASLKVSSYLDGMSAQAHQVSMPMQCNGKAITTLADYDQVVIIDDLIDAGNTLTWLVNDHLPTYRPKKVSAYFMLEKDRERAAEVNRVLGSIEAVCGKQVPDVWVVGYGLDIRLAGKNGRKALHLFRGRLPGGVYAFNPAIEKKLVSEYQEHPQQLHQQLQIFASHQ